MAKWQKVYETGNLVRANIVKNILTEKGLNPIILNKKDSSYNDFGQYEIHVNGEEVIKAIKIIEDEIVFE